MRALALFALIPALGCNRPDEMTSPGDSVHQETGNPAAECTLDEECEGWEICEGETCRDGDRNGSFEEAVALDWEDSVLGWLNPEEDWDFYAVTTAGGQFARIATRPAGAEAGEPEASADLDTVVAVYDAEGELISWEDDYPTGGKVTGSDSIVYTYLAAAGTYYIAVMDATTAYDRDEKHGGPDYAYVLTLQDYGSPPSEPDSFAAPGAEREVSGGYLYPVPILLEEEGDSDWVELSLPYGDCPVLVRGSAHLEGSDASPRVRLYSAEETLLLDLDDLGTDGVALYPDVDGGKALLEALDAEGGGGDDHWFFAIVSVYDQGYTTTIEGEEVAYQVDQEPNDALETAQLLDQVDVQTDSGGDYSAAFLWGTQDTAGDEDWYALHAEAGRYLTAYGTADYNGSLLDPAVEVYGPDGALLTAWYDGSDDAPDLMNLELTEGGTYYLRIFDESGSAPGGAAWFYRFAIYVTDFVVE